LKACENTTEVVPRVIPFDMMNVAWSALNGKRKRIELMGDSKVVVNWANAVWPVKNLYFTMMVSSVMNLIWSWHANNLVAPRQDHCNYFRHIYRELNTLTNDLATRGKHLSSRDCHLMVRPDLFLKMSFFRLSWDGGYDPGDDCCGVGFAIEGVQALPLESQTWTIVSSGYGRCEGSSALVAEMKACLCLCTVMNRLLEGTEKLWEPLPPWAA